MTNHNRVGILALEVYFPSSYVLQKDLEKANGASEGKYTIGLGQESMAFTGDQEDVNSISLTVLKALLEKYNISPSEIGRLEVGTESLVDKSKSTKTVLMSLFADSGNTDIEGATVLNACYGGTAALLNALTWVDSPSWDGRFAVVIAADIAVYADGPARPTGGCGSVAMLIGRNAPLQIDMRTRTTFSNHCWDFFKPNMDSEYPEVNGSLSQTCFLTALDDCYGRFKTKHLRSHGSARAIDETDYFLFHSPYNKLVQKAFARLLFHDASTAWKEGHVTSTSATLEKWLKVPIAETYEDKGLEAALKSLAAARYESKVAVSCELSKRIGNTYTASVYMNLANLVSEYGATLHDKTITLFSYGSGALASMFAVHPSNDLHSTDERFSLATMKAALNIKERLAQRLQKSPGDLALALEAREKAHALIPFRPAFSTDELALGTYYLEEINSSYERHYRRKETNTTSSVSYSKLKPSKSLSFHHQNGEDLGGIVLEDLPSEWQNSRSLLSSPSTLPRSKGLASATSPLLSLPRNKTFVWASGRPNVKVVVTGVAAALPGRGSVAMMEGTNNIHRIINGEMLISPIPDYVKDQMIEKNVIEIKKGQVGKSTRQRVSSYSEQINVCASIGKFDLTKYGLEKSIVHTMDTAVQVAIAAGLEALKEARIVSGVGVGTSGWVLPESMQNSTGIVYATSFPALDTAIAEVSKFYNTKTITGVSIPTLISGLRSRLEGALGGEALSAATEAALQELEKWSEAAAESEKISLSSGGKGTAEYEFDRKFLFRVLVLGNAQLAQIIKAKGPNMQTNAACAGATQAVALAYDMIQVGRAERVVVIAGDSASSDTLMPWLGNGFRILGAATTRASVEEASQPFSKCRSGMILGSGGIGIILESEDGARRRFMNAVNSGLISPTDVTIKKAIPFKCRLLGTLVSNSAFHGAAMDKEHIAQEMERFISSVEQEQGISRADIAQHGVYFSHETSTHASPTSSCAHNEIYGLRKVFGAELKNLLILNTKGFTGHPMGVSFEDVVAAEVLLCGIVPPIANMPDPSQYDPSLGEDLKFSRGGPYPCKYALRFAAGFGSQIALALYGSADLDDM